MKGLTLVCVLIVCIFFQENFLASMDAKDLDIDASDINNKNKMVR